MDAVQGPPRDPLNGPIAGLVEGDPFLGSHFSGRPTQKGGPHKYRPRPNRLWDHSKGPKGAPEPRLTGLVQYSPGSALSVENHCSGPWVCPSVLGTQRVHCMGPPPPNLARIPPKLPPGSLEATGDQSHTHFLIDFHRYCAPSPRTLVIKVTVCQHLLQVYTVLQMGLQTEPGAIGEIGNFHT